MDLSTALIIPIFLYGIFLVLLGIEYFTDKRRKVRAPPQKIASEPKKPPKKENGSSTEKLEDLEAGASAEREEPTGAPVIWEEKDFE